MTGTVQSKEERAAFQRVARLLGEFFVREADEPLLDRCRGEVGEALRHLGLPVPEPAEAVLEALAEEYFRFFLNPALYTPLVQSLQEEGRFEGEAARSLKQLLERLPLEFDRDAARGTPIDSLAAELLCWAELIELDPELANQFVERHLRWAIGPLRQRAADSRGEGGFYPALCSITADFLDQLDRG